MKLAWTSERRFNFAGEFYRVRGAKSDVQPLQKPHPPLFFGGSSEGALEMGARHCDVFAIFGEPLAETRDRIQDFRRRAAVFGRRVGFNMSLRPIIADTEGAAWDKANALLVASSTDRCNTFCELLSRRLIEQGLSRPFIELLCDGTELGLAVQRQIGAARKILAQ
jgi:alkanesulfonate monooxygenase SsuD/methylene tetrahydromethanopterin reductase-like flavin-dependent oxidoreductase (luciferase family)